MGFLLPKPPKQAKIDPMMAPTSDDRRVRAAAEAAERRARQRTDAGDTIADGTRRRRGGLAEAMRDVVGG